MFIRTETVVPGVSGTDLAIVADVLDAVNAVMSDHGLSSTTIHVPTDPDPSEFLASRHTEGA